MLCQLLPVSGIQTFKDLPKHTMYELSLSNIRCSTRYTDNNIHTLKTNQLKSFQVETINPKSVLFFLFQIQILFLIIQTKLLIKPYK